MKVALILCGEAHEDGPGFFLHKRVSLKCWNHHFFGCQSFNKRCNEFSWACFQSNNCIFCPLGGNIVDFALGCYGSHENEKHPGTKDGFPPQHVYRVVVGVSFFPFGEVRFCSCDSLWHQLLILFWCTFVELRIASSFSGWIPSATETTFDVGKMSHSNSNITLQVAKKWAARAMSHLFFRRLGWRGAPSDQWTRW